MPILYHSIRFVNTKIFEHAPALATQLTQLKFAIPRFILYLSTIILVVIGTVDVAKAQRSSAGVADVLSSETDERFARALEPITLQFPRDHGAHPEYQIEWWYYTGNLRTDDGKAFGYQLTFFRFALTPQMPERSSGFATNQVYMAHFAVTDASNGEYFCFERRSRGAGGLAGAMGDPTYKVWLEDWSATEVAPGVMRLHVPSTSDLIEAESQIGLSLNLATDTSTDTARRSWLEPKGSRIGKCDLLLQPRWVRNRWRGHNQWRNGNCQRDQLDGS